VRVRLRPRHVIAVGVAFAEIALGASQLASTTPIVALRAASLLDVRRGVAVRNAVVIVEGERIKAVGQTSRFHQAPT
jgi:hypothetical protein